MSVRRGIREDIMTLFMVLWLFLAAMVVLIMVGVAGMLDIHPVRYVQQHGGAGPGTAQAQHGD